MSVLTIVKSIQDIMRRDAGVDGDAQRISQLVWMLFLKIFDDREREIELSNRRYRSPVPRGLRWRDWAADEEGITGEELTHFIDNTLFPTLKDLETGIGTDPRARIVKNVFQDAYNYMKSGTLIRQVIDKINRIDFNRSADRHLLNDIYEKLLKDLQAAGNAGEYYTPRALTGFMVEMTAPKLGETILDPACGTGGFLVSALEHVRQSGAVQIPRHHERLINQLRGVEKKPLPHLLCMTNLILHQVDAPVNIRRDNTLARPVNSYGPGDRVDIVITNPPFGGIEEDGIQKNFPPNLKTKETADLFLIFIMKILKPLGRCAIVLPDGTLFGEGVKTRIKKEFLETCNLHTIVRLPKGSFSPYTKIKTNLFFFDKPGPTRDIWFYEHPYPTGYKSYSKTKPMTLREFDGERKWWNNRTENRFAWKATIDQIVERRYNLDMRNPNAPPVLRGDPVRLAKKFRADMSGIADHQNELKKELLDALLGGTVKIRSGHVYRETMDVYFDAMAQFPGGVSWLRRLILQAAVRGKLVPREPDEKIRLTLPADTGKEIPYQLPGGWTWVRMKDIAKLITDGTHLTPRYTETGKMFLSAKNIKPFKFMPKNHRCVAEEDFLKYTKNKKPEPGDVLFTRVGSNIGEAAVVDKKLDFAIYVSLGLIKLNRDVTDPQFIAIWLNSPDGTRKALENTYGYGVSQGNLNLGIVKRFILPLPPLNQQKRIAEKVRQLLDRCDRLESTLSSARRTGGEMFEALLVHL